MLRLIQLLVSLLFLFSGATALVYQVTWVRNLTLIFGASFQATSVVLASFMAGLSLGGFALGRTSERIGRPLRAYALLELGIAAFAVVLPSLLDQADAIYVRAALAADGVTPLLEVVRVALAFAVLVLPTFFMGATLPVLTKAFVGRYADFGSRLSWLYGINTLGAVVGAVAAGFFLIPHLGVWHTQLLAAAVNVAIGLLALAADWHWRTGVASLEGARGAADTFPNAAEARDALPPPLKPSARLGAQLAYRGAAVAGLCALALEVMWTRAISISVGTTTYSFTVMLAAFLTGIWLGSWLHALMPLPRIRPDVQMGLVMLGIGFSSALASYWIPRLPNLVLELNVALYGVQGRILPATILLAGFVVMLIPCIFMGLSFPLAGQARASLGSGFGRSAGDTLGWNTLGSIGGSLLAGFVLIPFVGLQRGTLLVAGIYTGYACVMLGAPLTVGLEARRWAGATTTAVFVAAALSFSWFAPAWSIKTLGAFENNKLATYVSAEGEVDVPGTLGGAVVVYYREGRGSTVSVVERGRSARGLLVNGKAVASDTLADIRHQLLLGHVPVLAHPDPKTALVIGLGTGFTLGAVTAHASLERITLVEIEPAVLDAQPLFAAVNGDPMADPRLRVHLRDGRNYLKTTHDRFDVITADPIHPWNRGSGYLFTAEYYRIAADRLEDRGVMCQWLPMYELSIENFKAVVATFQSIFPHPSLWLVGRDAVLIGSQAEHRIDFEELARRLAEPSVAAQLAVIGLEEPHAFLSGLALGPEEVRRYAGGAILNTDDNLYIEFASPLSIGTNEGRRNLLWINGYRGDWEGSALLSASDADRRRVSRSREAKQRLFQIGGFGSRPLRIAELRKLVEEFPDFGPARLQLSMELVSLGTIAKQRGKLEVAARYIQEAVELQPTNFDAHRGLGMVLVGLGRFHEAIVHLERALELRPDRWSTHMHLSRALASAGRVSEAVESLRTAAAINPDNPDLAEQLTRLTGATSLPSTVER